MAYADDLDSQAKQAVALELLGRACGESAGVLSLQVLQEYFVTAIRKLGVAVADALVIRASLQTRCTTLYSKDMHSGFRLGSAQIVNPFLEIQPSARQG